MSPPERSGQKKTRLLLLVLIREIVSRTSVARRDALSRMCVIEIPQELIPHAKHRGGARAADVRRRRHVRLLRAGRPSTARDRCARPLLTRARQYSISARAGLAR